MTTTSAPEWQTRDGFAAEAMRRVPKFEKTTQVPDELLREIRAVMTRPVNQLLGGYSLPLSGTVPGDLRRLIEKLPSPPPLDPVEECIKVYNSGFASQTASMRAALKRFVELCCPEIPK